MDHDWLTVSIVVLIVAILICLDPALFFFSPELCDRVNNVDASTIASKLEARSQPTDRLTDLQSCDARIRQAFQAQVFPVAAHKTLTGTTNPDEPFQTWCFAEWNSGPHGIHSPDGVSIKNIWRTRKRVLPPIKKTKFSGPLELWNLLFFY